MGRREFLKVSAGLVASTSFALPAFSKSTRENSLSEGNKVKKLEGLKGCKRYIAHMGCIESCLEYLGVEISTPWIYGGTGHAFIINISEDLCPSGPTAWHTDMLFELAPNLGYTSKGVKFSKEDANVNLSKEGVDGIFSGKQKEAWELAQTSIDQGLPCYGFQLQHPDFYVVNGYDDTGYLYKKHELYPGDGHLEWQKLGTWDVEVVEVYRVKTCDPAPVEKTVKDAFKMVLRHGEGEWSIKSGKWITGLNGLNIWADSIKHGKAMIDGHEYNAMCWSECREMAVKFLKEAKMRLDGKLNDVFDEAIEHYTVSRDRLKSLKEVAPKREKADWKTTFASSESATLIREAHEAETKGQECLKRISDAL